MAPWEHFSHDADIGVRGRGASPAEAFAAAARAMIAVICDPAIVRPEVAVEITCEAPDLELLLVDWLNAVIYEMAAEGRIFGDFEVTLGEGPSLHAIARGEALDPVRHAPTVEVKGATYTGLRVAREGAGWVAECVVDV
ncbi:MAG: archease [Myxococcales bacterium]|nr:archease [Myxococcales bacterium]MCB9702183.1 archease [Myxococcales bacterium]